MLGYTEQELNEMINALSEVQLYIPPGKAADRLRANVLSAQSFLEGLWSEGYFDTYGG